MEDDILVIDVDAVHMLENPTVLGYYIAASSGNFVPTFRATCRSQSEASRVEKKASPKMEYM